MGKLQLARDLAAADDRRTRRLRRGTSLVILGSPFRLSLADDTFAHISISNGFPLRVFVGAHGWRGDFACREHFSCSLRSPSAANCCAGPYSGNRRGKANPAFDGDRTTLPTDGVPLGWIGNLPGS